MIPLRDNQPTSTFPVVTIFIIAINVVVFLVQQTLSLDTSLGMVPWEITHGRDLSNIIGHIRPDGAVQLFHLPPDARGLRLGPNDIFYGPGPSPIWMTIFTSMFLHSSWLHIGGNMLYLYIFGNNIKDALGKVRFLLFYFACGAFAALAQIATDPNSLIPTIGASGAIAGVLGAYLILYPQARVLSIVPLFGLGFLAEVRAVWVLGLWIALQLFQGFAGGGMMQGGGVAYFAHIGGFFAGLVLIYLLGGPRLVARQKQRSTFDLPP